VRASLGVKPSLVADYKFSGKENWIVNQELKSAKSELALAAANDYRYPNEQGLRSGRSSLVTIVHIEFCCNC